MIQQLTHKTSDPHQQHQNSFHQKCFGFAIMLMQIAVAILYGFYHNSSFAIINVSSIVFAIFLAILIIVGFGLYMSYLRSLQWSALGVPLFLMCLAIELYPLVNSFWSKATIFENPRLSDSFNIKGFNLLLANFDSNLNTGNTITGCMRCALALVVAASGIIGRSTPLDLLLFGTFGTVTFELNRQIIAQAGHDQFGSSTIFGFGGFLSLGAGLIFLLMKGQQQRQQTEKSGIHSSVNSSLLGSLVIFLFLPVLAAEGDNSIKRELFSGYVTPLCLILSMGSAIVTSIAISIFLNNGTLRVRDVQNGLIAGGVVGGSASYFITSPVYALICGVAGATFQPIFENLLERNFYKRVGLYCTYPPAVFGLQSFLSAIFTAIYAARVNSGTTNSIVYTGKQISSGQIFATYFISAGIGFVTGLVIGFICKIIRPSGVVLTINDKELWVVRDNLKLPIQHQRQYEEGRIYAPEIAANLHRSNVSQQPKFAQPQVLRRTTSIQDLQYELDFVDMLQVPIQ